MRMDVHGRDPFREIADLFEPWRRGAQPQLDSTRQSAWVPLCDIQEDVNEITVVAEIPGVRMEDIDIEVTADGLVISGERKSGETSDGQWVRVERQYGAFSRSFSIGVPVNISAVKASYRDGLLTVVIPKSEAVKPKKISVEVG